MVSYDRACDDPGRPNGRPITAMNLSPLEIGSAGKNVIPGPWLAAAALRAGLPRIAAVPSKSILVSI
jgi:hypothetical protein